MANRETRLANAFETELTTQMGPTDLTANVVTTVGGPATPCILVIDPTNSAKREVVLFDGVFTATAFVTSGIGNRYLAGSAAASGITHEVGAKVRCAPLAQHIEDVNDRVDHYSDHGNLSGLADDDHTQYLNVARHDTTARHGASVVDHGIIGGLGDDDHPQYLLRSLVDLDDWTTFTPTVTQSGSVTLSTAAGRYWRLGRTVLGSIYCVVSGAGTGNNAILVGGLPVASRTLPGSFLAVGSFSLRNADIPATYSGTAAMATTTSFEMWWGDGVPANVVGREPNFALASGDIIGIHFQYEAAA